jgi:hypothetical protein
MWSSVLEFIGACKGVEPVIWMIADITESRRYGITETCRWTGWTKNYETQKSFIKAGAADGHDATMRFSRRGLQNM